MDHDRDDSEKLARPVSLEPVALPRRQPTRLSPGQRIVGMILVASAATCFSLSTVMGRYALDSGADPITTVAGRFLIAVGVLAALVRLRGKSFAISRPKRWAAMAIGVGTTASSLGYFSAIDLVPVSLAVLVFYTFPILVGVAVRFTEGEPLTVAKLGALLLAFGGIAIALDVQTDGLDPRGLLFACVPAIAIGSITLFGGRAMAGQDVGIMVFYMFVTGSAITVVALVAQGGPSWPSTVLGWFGFFGVPACFIVGNQLFFSAFARIRAVDIAMVMNMEPVTTILFALVLLGEVLSAVQYGGAMLIVLAICWMTALRRGS